MEWYRNFLRKHGIVGLLMTFLAFGYVTLIFVQGGLQEGFTDFYNKLTFPMEGQALIGQPWSLLTYWWTTHPYAIWLLLVDMYLLYTFGHILNAMLGDLRTQGLVLFGLFVVPLIAFVFVNLLPTVEQAATAHLFGLMALNSMLIAAAITLVPNYEFRIIRWNVPLIYVGIILLAIPIIGGRAIWTVYGTAAITGALSGFGVIRALRAGLDLTKWGQFRLFGDGERVRTRTRARAGGGESSPRRSKITVVHSRPASDEEELNRILDRINDVGYEGLTRKEKETLDRLSGQ